MPTIEQGIEILTGMEAGEIQSDGTYPEGTLFSKADERLREITEIVKKFGKEEEGKSDEENENSSGCSSCGK